jgi:hypothetical protein
MKNRMNDSIEKQLNTLGHFLGNTVCQTLGPSWVHKFRIIEEDGSITLSIVTNADNLDVDIGIRVDEIVSISDVLKSCIGNQGLKYGDVFIINDGKSFGIEVNTEGCLDMILQNGGAGWTLSRS